MFPTSGKAAHKGDNSGQVFNAPGSLLLNRKPQLGPDRPW